MNGSGNMTRKGGHAAGNGDIQFSGSEKQEGAGIRDPHENSSPRLPGSVVGEASMRLPPLTAKIT